MAHSSLYAFACLVVGGLGTSSEVTARGAIRWDESPPPTRDMLQDEKEDETSRAHMVAAWRDEMERSTLPPAPPPGPQLLHMREEPGCLGPAATVDELQQRGADGVSSVYNVEPSEVWHHKGQDSEAEWREEGGMTEAHVYGEVTRKGMFDILQKAACLAKSGGGCNAKDATRLQEAFRKLRFFDLGAGQGKFPTFAALAGMTAHGIELDHHRFDVAKAALAEFDKQYPCLKGKLSFQEGSFTDNHAEWTKGNDPRVVFLDAVCFGELWGDITRMMKDSCERWGTGSVVVVLGQQFKPEESSLQLIEQQSIETSWSAQVDARFYRFADQCKTQSVTKPFHIGPAMKNNPVTHAHWDYREKSTVRPGKHTELAPLELHEWTVPSPHGFS